MSRILDLAGPAPGAVSLPGYGFWILPTTHLGLGAPHFESLQSLAVDFGSCQPLTWDWESTDFRRPFRQSFSRNNAHAHASCPCERNERPMSIATNIITTRARHPNMFFNIWEVASGRKHEIQKRHRRQGQYYKYPTACALLRCAKHKEKTLPHMMAAPS